MLGFKLRSPRYYYSSTQSPCIPFEILNNLHLCLRDLCVSPDLAVDGIFVNPDFLIINEIAIDFYLTVALTYIISQC